MSDHAAFEAGQSEGDWPPFACADHFLYLEGLRKSGVTNMFGASPYLHREFRRGDFKLTEPQAVAVLSYWMKNYARLKKELEW